MHDRMVLFRSDGDQVVMFLVLARPFCVDWWGGHSFGGGPSQPAHEQVAIAVNFFELFIARWTPDLHLMGLPPPPVEVFGRAPFFCF